MRRAPREIVFEVRRGRLVRQVRLQDGRTYTQQCTLDAFEAVAQRVEARREVGVTTNELWSALPDLPCTQISIALAFLKDRGCVETSGRRSYAGSAPLLEAALTEFNSLAPLAARGA